MKTTLSLFIALLIGSTIAAQTAKADYRNALVYTSANYRVEYSFGQVAAYNGGRPNGDWTPLPYSISSSNLPTISGWTDFSKIATYTATTPMTLTADQWTIAFDLEASASSTSISGASDATATKATVELVDANSGSVLATMYTFSSFQNVSWTTPGSSSLLYYTVPTAFAGRNVYVRMSVAWTGGSGGGSYDLTASTAAQSLGYNALSLSTAAPTAKASKSMPLVAMSHMLLANSPNPVSNFTTIQIQNASAPVSLKVYDAVGREVADLTNSLSSSGNMQIAFNTSALRTGIYFYRLVTANGVLQNRMIVNR